MPELPEVETTCRGIEPHVKGQIISAVKVRNPHLRWPVPASLNSKLQHELIEAVSRRGKYILLHTGRGAALVHLGMSGSLRIINAGVAPEKHDHVDIVMGNGQCLRLRDPRRFGSLLWAGRHPLQHKLLCALGPEPLSDEFNAEYLYIKSRQRKQAIKTFIMDSHLVVGVGNIYASESLFRCGIHPQRAAGKVAAARYELLANAIKQVLTEAITNGGTTLRDFVNGEGAPGYFAQKLHVYGRNSQPCHRCKREIRQIVQAQRSSFYCPGCQH